jgi:hypothetical protein
MSLNANIDDGRSAKIYEQAEVLTDLSISLGKSGANAFSLDNLKSVEKELKFIGIDLHHTTSNGESKITDLIKRGQTKLASLSASNSTNNSNIGQNTFEISNQLIQDISPELKLAESPFDTMMPYKNINAVEYQQDILQSNYGVAQSANGVKGANNVVPFLTSNGVKFEGRDYVEQSFISGRDLIALREYGSSDTTAKGEMLRRTYQRLLLLARQETGIELNRIDMIRQGSIHYGNQESYATINAGIPLQNLGQLSQSLGSYDNATNKFTPNINLTTNVLVELGNFLTPIRNAGLKIKSIVMDNICYNAIFNSAPIQAKTLYTSAVSSNNVMQIRDNLFRLTTIPDLQGVPLEVYSGSWKLNSDITTTKNTRPLMWGLGEPGTNNITSTSFRAVVVVEQSGLSRIGELGFFPNQYMRNTAVAGGQKEIASYGGGGIVLMEQDLSVLDITNQTIQMLSASTYSPMVYQSHLLYPFDFNVPVS